MLITDPSSKEAKDVFAAEMEHRSNANRRTLSTASPEWKSWYGRKLFLAEKQNRFYCGGFYVNRINPIAFVSGETQVNHIVEAVNAGILIDITDNDKEIIIRGTGHSSTTMENTGKKVYITEGRDGALAIKAAETPEEIAKCEEMIKDKGIIVPHEYKIADPLGVIGRIQGGEASLVLHNLEEKVSNANEKVREDGGFRKFGDGSMKKGN